MAESKQEQNQDPTRAQGLARRVNLNHGGAIPCLGLGAYRLGDDPTTAAAVREAIARGYRQIDTAALYGNERGVGEGVRTSGVPRDELFVTTKLWNTEMRARRQREAFDESFDRLRLGYIDLFLLHWPIEGHIVESWQVLESLVAGGRVRAIGVSNFMIPHLETLLGQAKVVPAVNQIEFHPYLRSSTLLEYCAARDICVSAWSPFMCGGPILRDPVLLEIGADHGKTAAQVILRWNLQSGVVALPKSSRPERMRENADIFDFSLSDDEMAAIDRLDRGERSGSDPFNFAF